LELKQKLSQSLVFSKNLDIPPSRFHVVGSTILCVNPTLEVVSAGSTAISIKFLHPVDKNLHVVGTHIMDHVETIPLIVDVLFQSS